MLRAHPTARGLLVVALAMSGCAGAADRSAPRPPGVHRVGVVRAADGSPLERVGGLDGLARELAHVHAARLRHGDVRTAIRPALQRALVAALAGRPGAGVIVDVPHGRVLAAAGSAGRSPWRSVQAPGATLDAVLAAGALDARILTPATPLNGDDGPGRVTNLGGRRFGPLTLEQALAVSSATAFADIAVRMDGHSVDQLLDSVGFDAGARVADLRGLVRPSRGPRLTPTGVHGVGSAPNFVDAHGAFRDLGTRARTTTFGLAQVALALASGGRRSDIGVTRAGPLPSPYPPWTAGAGRQVEGMLAAATHRGPASTADRGPVSSVALGGSAASADGAAALSIVAFAPARDPQVALALTGRGPAGTAAGPVLGPLARKLLEQAVLGR